MSWKEEYINKIKKYHSTHIYIYGAGQVAEYVYEVCHEGDIQISGFAVSAIQQQSESEKNGLPISSVNQILEEETHVLLLIGAIENNRNQMIHFLTERGFKDYIDVPEGIYGMNPWLALKRRSSMEITPIVGCSIQCRYCPQKLFVSRYFRENEHRTSKMSFAQYQVCLDKLPKDTFIEFSGFVEPFLNPESVDMMEYTYEKGYAMSLFTTLTGLNRDGFDRIRKISFERVVLHTPDEEGYANIPVTKEYWELLEAVLDAKNADGSSFVTSANCQGVPSKRFLEVARGRGEVTSRLHDRAGNLETNENIVSNKIRGKIFCGNSHNLNRNVLLPDGSVVLCCNDFGMQHVLGNLLLEDYNHILQGEEMRRIKRAMIIDESVPLLCRKCFFAKNLE